MTKLRAFRKSEEGAVAVIVAIGLTVLLGFAALAVDFGMMASCRASMQNAADAAALAAAAAVGEKRYGLVYRTAADYCAANGYDPADGKVNMDAVIVGKTVTVTLDRDLKMGFSAVVTGKRVRTVTVSATAEATSIFGSCPYAMFAGQHIDDAGSGIEITGNNIEINGDIHSNSDISMKNAVLGPGAMATAVNNTNPATSGWNSHSIARDMPSFRSFESAFSDMPEIIEFPGDVVKNSKTGFQELIDDAVEAYRDRLGSGDAFLDEGLYIHIGGDLTFNGHNSTAYQASFPIVIVADGDIDLNGATINSTYDFPVSVMSKEGSITVNGGGAVFTGIIFAPQGDVTLNGNQAEFIGSIVAQNIRKNGGKTTISYMEELDRFLPRTKVHLIA